MTVTITPAVRAVLRELLIGVMDVQFGCDLMRVTGQGSGKSYPILSRLTEAGVLERLSCGTE